MILSHSRKFILYRTRKAASSTLEQTLAVHCRTGDWISIVYLTDEQKKRFAGSVMEVWAERQPGSTGIPYSIAPPGHRLLRQRFKEWIHCDDKDALEIAKPPRHPLARNRSSITDYTTIVGVRNPWAWVFSVIQHAGRGGIDRSVEEVLRAERNPVVPGCDHFVRFEHLLEDIEKLGEVLGLDLQPPHINDHNADTDYVSFFDNRTRELVAQACAPMIKQFGYEFGQ